MNPLTTESTGWRSEVLFGIALALRIVATFMPEFAEGLIAASDMSLTAGGITLARRVAE